MSDHDFEVLLDAGENAGFLFVYLLYAIVSADWSYFWLWFKYVRIR